MKATDLFVDIVLVGFLTLTWICGFAFSYIVDINAVKGFLVDSSEIALFLILIISYCLGIVFDYINSGIFSLLKSKSEKELYKDMSIVKVLDKNEKMDEILESYYGRLRVLRSIIISIPLLTWSVSAFIYNNVHGLKVSVNTAILCFVFFGIFLFIISIISYVRRNKDYKKYIKDLKDLYLKD